MLEELAQAPRPLVVQQRFGSYELGESSEDYVVAVLTMC